ncbi:hypothetical protein SLEP1_g5347 [Rubroshorea leprosula]|uniref:Uncharacterized protein n=1 Tax=Rubroshorea leprosula TaxID=152421 RepID=A0AAV5I2G3_9ROSI|nr:hypothetical protein SLEP1_g5347 [Rubroshorea leprosula]
MAMVSNTRSQEQAKFKAEIRGLISNTQRDFLELQRHTEEQFKKNDEHYGDHMKMAINPWVQEQIQKECEFDEVEENFLRILSWNDLVSHQETTKVSTNCDLPLNAEFKDLSEENFSIPNNNEYGNEFRGGISNEKVQKVCNEVNLVDEQMTSRLCIDTIELGVEKFCFLGFDVHEAALEGEQIEVQSKKVEKSGL